VVLYAGTLGMKHDPELLAALAERLAAAAPDSRVVVVSQGAGADYLAEARRSRGLNGLVLLPFQPFEALPDVLASADVLAAVLEPEAGTFSVPSKVLTYLCAGRAVLLSVPPENLAARIVAREGAGRVVPPGHTEAFVEAAAALLADPAGRADAARAARAYAERTFDIEAIADRFEGILVGS
jgi:glycosyltransferase involved in cell wall biosynthesis